MGISLNEFTPTADRYKSQGVSNRASSGFRGGIAEEKSQRLALDEAYNIFTSDTVDSDTLNRIPSLDTAKSNFEQMYEGAKQTGDYANLQGVVVKGMTADRESGILGKDESPSASDMARYNLNDSDANFGTKARSLDLLNAQRAGRMNKELDSENSAGLDRAITNVPDKETATNFNFESQF